MGHLVSNWRKFFIAHRFWKYAATEPEREFWRRLFKKYGDKFYREPVT